MSTSDEAFVFPNASDRHGGHGLTSKYPHRCDWPESPVPQSVDVYIADDGCNACRIGWAMDYDGAVLDSPMFVVHSGAL